MYGEMYKNANDVLLGVVLLVVGLLSLWAFLMVGREAAPAFSRDDRKWLVIIGILILLGVILLSWSAAVGGFRF